jgi:hypothetical protein
MCSDGSEGRRISSPTGLTDRVKGGQIWTTKSLPEKPAGLSPPVFVDGRLEAGRQSCFNLQF